MLAVRAISTMAFKIPISLSFLLCPIHPAAISHLACPPFQSPHNSAPATPANPSHRSTQISDICPPQSCIPKDGQIAEFDTDPTRLPVQMSDCHPKEMEYWLTRLGDLFLLCASPACKSLMTIQHGSLQARKRGLHVKTECTSPSNNSLPTLLSSYPPFTSPLICQRLIGI